MGSWQKRARLGVAVVGVVTAGVVYLAMRERPEAAAPAAIIRMDAKSVVEVAGAVLQGITGIEKNFEIESTRNHIYPDGSTKFVDGVTIIVRKGDDRTFTVRATEALTDKDRVSIELMGQVRLEDSDGFFLTTDQATYDRAKSIARTTGAVSFGKGRMSGTGVGITYDQANNVLQVAAQAQVTTRDEAGMAVMEFTAGAATLDRLRHRLTVEETVHVVRGEQVIDADRAVASLSQNDDIIQFLELRGNSRVQGGGADIDAMSARDINLDYTDDGVRLEAVSLTGTAAVARAGQNGAGQQMVGEMIDVQLAQDGASHMRLKGNGAITMIGEQGKDGRRIAGQSLDLNLAADGTLTRAIGREDVRLEFPAAANVPRRTIRANSLDGTGEAGKGLTETTFDGNVVFTEDERRANATAKDAASAMRTARSQRLHASLAADAVTSATFTIEVTFEETGLKACAGRVDYQPEKGALALSGVTAAGKAIVAEEQVTIEADTIDVALDTRRMNAQGNVTMQVRTATRCKPATARAAASQGPNRMPGLLKQDAGATIRAAMLDYEGAAGKALYSGRALMSQGDTSITSDTLELDQNKGDLVATGNAISTMAMDGAQSTGRAHEIRYLDTERVIRYSAPPPPPPGTVPPVPAVPAAPPGRGRGPAQAKEPQLSVPQGDLSADEKIEVVLAEGGGTAERIEAYTNVRMRQQGQRSASDGARLTYYADEQKYVMTAGAAAPVKLIAECREFRGKTLTFYRTDDRISIDGQDVRRTQTTKATGPCQPPAPR